MKLDIRAVALAEGIIGALIFIICAFFIAIAPEATATFSRYVFHIDLAGIARPLNWGGLSPVSLSSLYLWLLPGPHGHGFTICLHAGRDYMLALKHDANL